MPHSAYNALHLGGANIDALAVDVPDMTMILERPRAVEEYVKTSMPHTERTQREHKQAHKQHRPDTSQRPRNLFSIMRGAVLR